jgi:hypothetical protein
MNPEMYIEPSKSLKTADFGIDYKDIKKRMKKFYHDNHLAAAFEVFKSPYYNLEFDQKINDQQPETPDKVFIGKTDLPTKKS